MTFSFGAAITQRLTLRFAAQPAVQWPVRSEGVRCGGPMLRRALGTEAAYNPGFRVQSLAISLVLIVEDEPLLRMLAASFLEEAGFDTLAAGSADEAIVLLEARNDIRVVFTDINLPGSMDGLRLAHMIRHRWPPIELVLTSGRARVQDKDLPERGLFLDKPYDRTELIGMMRSLTH